MSYNNTYFETEETVLANFFKKLINWDSWVLLYNQSFINSCPAFFIHIQNWSRNQPIAGFYYYYLSIFILP